MRVDPSWILIFALLVYQLAFIVFPYELGARPRRGLAWDVIALAVIASVLLFGSVVAHELAHALMARVRGVSVLSITLFIFGGVAQIGDEPDSPATEFLIAIVGPLISLVIAIIAGAVWMWLQVFDAFDLLYRTPLERLALYVSVVALYLAQTNLLLALFNMLPGFPLDGGRVLRALVWAILKDPKRATYWGMLSGRALALLLASIGGLFILRGEYGGGWSLLMAWFLWRAAGDAYHGWMVRELLKQVTAGELMRMPAARVSEALSLRELADAFRSWLRPPAVAVDLQGLAVGVIGMDQLEKINRAQWETMRVRQAMLPLSSDNTVRSSDPALHALKKMTEQDREAVAVVQEEQVLGTLGREELARYLQSKGE